MKNSERLIKKVTQNFWNTLDPKKWHPVKTIRFWGVVESVEKGVTDCRLESYQNDFDKYSIGDTFSVKINTDEFPIDDVEEGLVFEFIISDYEGFKKHNSEHTIDLPDTMHTIICKVIKSTNHES